MDKKYHPKVFVGILIISGLILGSALLFARGSQVPALYPVAASSVAPSFFLPDEQGALYVDSAAASGGNGGSWEQALTQLSDALQLAHSDTAIKIIRVAAGTYYPTGAAGGINRDSAFVILRGGLRLFGGYDATSGQRDVENNRTVLSGNIGNGNDSTDNSYHVFVISNIPAASDSIVIDGFSIREANADGQAVKKYNGQDIRQKDGGGLYFQLVKGPFLISHCRIERNTAQEWGGGMYLAGGSAPDMTRCLIVANRSAVGGGILNNEESSPRLLHCTIAGNSIWQNSGGGIFNNHSHPQFINCLIVDNVSDGSSGGGGMRNFASSPILINTVVAGNQSTSSGAGMRNNSSSKPLIYNSIIWDNTKEGSLDNIYNDNVSTDHPLFHNSYLQRDGVSWVWNGNSTGVNGGGNVIQTQTPFADGGQGDYHLKGGSLAINAGDNDSLPTYLHVDLDWNPRIFDSTVDMGAYEYQDISVMPDADGIVYVDSAAAPGGTGSSWGDALSTLQKALGAANSNGEIREVCVAAGHYYPTGEQSAEVRDEAFALLRGGLKLRGGYDASSGVQDIVQNTTVLSGDIGTPGDSTDNSYHVLVLANLSAQQDSMLIEGFTISAGNATGSKSTGKQYNGLLVFGVHGGGMYMDKVQGPVVMRQCVFLRNTALNWGGGIYISNGSTPRLENCVIKNNHALEAGGGVLNDKKSGPVFIDCKLMGNTAVSNSGGGMFSNDSHPYFVNCLISGNRSLGGNGSGGLRNFKSPATLINCVIANNTAPNGAGGGIRNNGGGYTTTVTNSILWNNVSMGNVDNIHNDATTDWPRLAYTCLQGDSGSWEWDAGYSGIDGGGNLISSTSPFVDAASGDFHLVTGNPAINGGSNDSLPAGIEKDLAGQHRFVDGSVDMGVYEDQNGPVMVIIQPNADGIVYVSDSAEAGGNGSSWERAANALNQVLETANHKTAIKEIRIAGGVYYPTGAPDGTERDSAFVIARGGLTLTGGYAYQSGIRKPKSQSTILSGDIGLVGDSTDNSYHVLVIGKMDTAQAEVVLDGLTIRDGQADGSGTHAYQGQLVPRNKGAGVYLDSVLNNVIVRHATVIHNTADSGGGLFAGNGSAPWFSQSLFSGNTALHKGGGALVIHEGNPWLINTAFYANVAGDKGGAIYSDDNSRATITNANFYGNTAGDKGGALYNNAGSDVVISNTIIYGNSADGIYNNASNPVLSYSIVQGVTNDPVNHLYGTDPLFMNPANNNFHLQVGSPAIDAGSNSAYSAAGGDLAADRAADGIPRVYGAVIDIGVYEFFNCPGATTLHVNALAAGGDGSSWGQPLQTLSQALQIATFCPQVDSILVAEGTYYPTGAQNGTNRDSAFVIIRGGLVLLGGYNASGTQRDPAEHETILSGNVGQLSDSLDNSYHVLVIPGMSGEEDDVRVEGFTITAGHADRNQAEGKPMNGQLVYRNNGGGIYTTGVKNKTVIAQCRIIGNSAYFGGGIFNIDQSGPRLVDCVIADNTAAFGAGITNGNGSAPQLVNCVLTRNTAAFEGGAMANTLHSSPDIINSTIVTNHAEGKGAGIYNGKSSPALIDPSLNNNTCSGLDMVDYTTDYSSPNISNSILWDNYNGSGIMENIYSVTTARPVYRNNYLQGDSSLWDWDGVFGGIDSSGNIITLESPFKDVEEDFSLDSGAWAIDAGRNNLLPEGITTDAAGGTRIVNAIIDMGAFEFNLAAPVARVLISQPEEVAVCVGETAVFEVQAEGPHLHCQWQYSDDGIQWRNASRANAVKLTIKNVNLQHNGKKYRIVVTSASKKDTSKVARLTVHPRPKVSITADRANPVPADQFVRLSISGGSHFQWQSAPGIQNGEDRREVAIIARKDADYHVMVTDSNGCSLEQQYALKVEGGDNLGFPNILTPNGDGINDQWIIPHLEKYANNMLEIFNRAGQLVYRQKNYANDWIGSANGKILPTGTYYFIFMVNNGARVHRGYIHVIQGGSGQTSGY